MSWLTIIIASLQFLFLWFKSKIEQDVRIRQQKKDAAAMLKAGIVERDRSKITAAFDRVRNMKR